MRQSVEGGRHTERENEEGIEKEGRLTGRGLKGREGVGVGTKKQRGES